MFIYVKYMEMIITNTWLVMAFRKSEGGIGNWTGVLRESLWGREMFYFPLGLVSTELFVLLF